MPAGWGRPGVVPRPVWSAGRGRGSAAAFGPARNGLSGRGTTAAPGLPQARAPPPTDLRQRLPSTLIVRDSPIHQSVRFRLADSQAAAASWRARGAVDPDVPDGAVAQPLPPGASATGGPLGGPGSPRRGSSAETVSSPESKDSGLVCRGELGGPRWSGQWPNTAPTAALSRQPRAPTAGRRRRRSRAGGRRGLGLADQDRDGVPEGVSPLSFCIPGLILLALRGARALSPWPTRRRGPLASASAASPGALGVRAHRNPPPRSGRPAETLKWAAGEGGWGYLPGRPR